ncbi:MAG: hypothetical protein JNL74_18705 [Fibrobacteres bacterium]|nr:hypothetical protein [Fibrobacterota bacterium]
MEQIFSNAEKALLIESARLAGDWFVNTQNSTSQSWGCVRAIDSADRGRYLEKVHPARSPHWPAAIWIQGIATFSLLNLKQLNIPQMERYEKSAVEAARYLASCQCFNKNWPDGIGGFHEFFPNDSYSAPRDAASAAIACLSLYRHTHDFTWLNRAESFATWYSTKGCDSDGYPWDDFDLQKGKGISNLRGDWQAGGGLLYYQLYSLTGNEQWKEALYRILDILVDICDKADPNLDTAYTFHGQNILSVGNDDFANTVLLAGFKLFKEMRFLKLFEKRMRLEWTRQAESGAFPGYGGTFVTSIEMIDALEMIAQGVEILPQEELVYRLRQAALFSLTTQERHSTDRYLLGGVFGESNYAYGRDIIHARDTAYGIQLWLKLAGFEAKEYSIQGW